MFLPSQSVYEELLGARTLARFGMAEGSDGPEATLVVKASSLALRYVLGSRFDVLLLPLSGNILAYVARIHDDPINPVYLWSIVERDVERAALLAILEARPCSIHLFNEASVNVCSGVSTFAHPGQTDMVDVVRSADLCQNVSERTQEVNDLLDAIYAGDGGQRAILAPEVNIPWSQQTSVYITNRLTPSVISLASSEGEQQEELIVWLTDWLSPDGAARGPQIHEASKDRELCDVLINYSEGWFLFESKALGLATMKGLPTRQKLTGKVMKAISKAVDQLRGGYKRVIAGSVIRSKEGAEIRVKTSTVGHAIILVPDLSLLSGQPTTGRPLLREFGLSTRGGLLHILDPGELLSLAQNAEYLARRSTKTSSIMAFDAVLVSRWQKAATLDTADLRYAIRLK